MDLMEELPDDVSVRMSFFNPRTGQTEWFNVLDVAGKSLSCSEHPEHPGIPSYLRGLYNKEDKLVLEYDLRLECKYSGMASVLQEDRKYELFLGNEATGPAVFKRVEATGYSTVQCPEGYERVQFTLSVPKKQADLLRARIGR